MKKYILIIITVIIFVAVFTGCMQRADKEFFIPKNVDTTSSTQWKEESTTKKSITGSATESFETTSDTKTEDKTTTAKLTITTTKSVEKKTDFTIKHTTTKRVTTTHKTTTTEKAYWCEEGGTHHITDVGDIGWVDTYDKAVDKSLEYISDHNTSGNFRVKQCLGCGLYTATVTLD